MVVTVDGVLDTAALAEIKTEYAGAPFGDGRMTAGDLAAKVKRNLQLPAGEETARRLTAKITRALYGHPRFVAAALPKVMGTPLFNRYLPGMGFGRHVDNAIRLDEEPFRTDLSATLFISEPQEYEGGELVIEDAYGPHALKLKAGGLVLYPSGSLHEVRTVTRGCRDVVVFWIQSMVRDAGRRAILFELDGSIQSLRKQLPESPEIVSLTGIYHNLLRLWADL